MCWHAEALRNGTAQIFRGDLGLAWQWEDDPGPPISTLEIAAERFLQRLRHPGHLDGESSAADVLASLRQLTHLPALEIGQRIDVNTSQEPNLTDVVRAIREAQTVLPGGTATGL